MENNEPAERTVLIQNNEIPNYDSINDGADTSSDTENVESPARYWKNQLVMCFCFFLIMTSYSSIQNLESTLNYMASLGVSSLACIYGSVAITCLIAPVFVSRVGPKWTIAAGMVGQVVFSASNFYPQFYTLIPASVLLGLLSGPMWTGQGAYITQLATDYAKQTLDVAEHCVSRFNGIFYMFFTGSQVVGNLISSLVLFDSKNQNSTVTNFTQCGATFCGFNGSDEKINPPQGVVYTLIGIYVGCTVLGLVLFCVFVDNRPQVNGAQSKSAKSLALATIQAHKDVLLALLVPTFFWTGMEQAFMFGEYTQAFVSCHLGIGHVGYAMISFGAADVIFSFIVGRLEKVTGRTFIILGAFSLNIGLLVTMLLWDPVTGNQRTIYVLPGLWGITDATWNVTVCALLGTVFTVNMEAAFATFRMWQSLGFMVMFLISPHLCMREKIYAAISICSLASVLYAIMEIIKRRRVQRPWLDLYDPVD